MTERMIDHMTKAEAEAVLRDTERDMATTKAKADAIYSGYKAMEAIVNKYRRLLAEFEEESNRE
jgi:asparagine synthetase A